MPVLAGVERRKKPALSIGLFPRSRLAPAGVRAMPVLAGVWWKKKPTPYIGVVSQEEV